MPITGLVTTSMSARFTKLTSFAWDSARTFLDRTDALAPKATGSEPTRGRAKVGIIFDQVLSNQNLFTS